jgi:hypothetical protein
LGSFSTAGSEPVSNFVDFTNWGDGTQSELTVSQTGATDFFVNGAHT